MKLFILTVCVLFIAIQSIQGDDGFMDSFKECLDESDIKASDLEELRDNDDPKVHCVMACVMEKGGILQNGDIKVDFLKKDLLEDAEKLGEKKISDLVDNCVKISKDLTDVCDKANLLEMCIEEELEKYGIKFD